ncbi:TonB-dependent receptor [Nitrospira sp. KM1]|uniref:TonB-dependent siderophore receptor n=1 Tax=Nitrospira sp. KM1 TaxID=1936990 RepID=UPI002108491A|nr:TonB-dependent receptor [Nitrospira sp. KM1]
MAQADTVAFNIAPQDLKTALTAFAEVSGWQLFYSTEMAEGRRTSGLSGQYAPEDGLRQLLAGTGVGYRLTGPKTVTLKRADGSALVPVPLAAGAAAAAAEGAATTGTANQKPVKVPEIMVKDVRERDADTKSYVAEEASTATRTDTPVRDIPQSIQVITRKVIEEQRAFRLSEALQNISGFNAFLPTSQTFEGFIIRGFTANNNNFFRNGLFDRFGAQFGADTYNIQRLEVLKGPASVLYGLGDPGGIINVVTRKPLPDAAYSGNVTLGNFNFYRSELDATGPLNANKTLMYRLNVVGQKANTFMDIARRDLVALTPSVTWLMSSRTTLTVQGEYIRRWYNDLSAAAVPAQGTVLPNANGELSRNFFGGFGEFDKNNRTLYRIGYDFNHELGHNWSIRNAYQYSILEIDQFGNRPLALLDQRTLTRSPNANPESSISRSHMHSMVTNLVGHFKILEMDHTLLTGLELRQERANPTVLTNRGGASLNLDIFSPNYGINPFNAPITATNYQEGELKLAGVYLQDQIALLPNLKFVGGVRFDYVNQSAIFAPLASNPPDQTSDDTAVSPRLGLVYQPIEPVSLYATWMRGFLPVSPGTFNPGGALFKPERSTLYEIGVKTFFFENRVSTTLAWYRLTRDNILTLDPLAPGFQVQTGQQRSQGIELDVTATLTSGWNVIASYAYTDAEVTQDNDLTIVHKRLGNVPYNKATLWSTYHFQDGSLKGFGVGGGVYGYTSRNASIFGPGQLEIPGAVTINTALYYDRDLPAGNWLGAKVVNVALNFRNLFDQRYVESAQNTTTRLYFGEPRTVLATVGLRF